MHFLVTPSSFLRSAIWIDGWIDRSMDGFCVSSETEKSRKCRQLGSQNHQKSRSGRVLGPLWEAPGTILTSRLGKSSKSDFEDLPRASFFASLCGHCSAHGDLTWLFLTFLWGSFFEPVFLSFLGDFEALKSMILEGCRHGSSVVNSVRIRVLQVFKRCHVFSAFQVLSGLTFWGHFGT